MRCMKIEALFNLCIGCEEHMGPCYRQSQCIQEQTHGMKVLSKSEI